MSLNNKPVFFLMLCLLFQNCGTETRDDGGNLLMSTLNDEMNFKEGDYTVFVISEYECVSCLDKIKDKIDNKYKGRGRDVGFHGILFTSGNNYNCLIDTLMHRTGYLGWRKTKNLQFMNALEKSMPDALSASMIEVHDGKIGRIMKLLK